MAYGIHTSLVQENGRADATYDGANAKRSCSFRTDYTLIATFALVHKLRAADDSVMREPIVDGNTSDCGGGSCYHLAITVHAQDVEIYRTCRYLAFGQMRHLVSDGETAK